jgi:xeroderma pigmentosum group C-complementing protein
MRVVREVDTWAEIKLDLSNDWTPLCAVNGLVADASKFERYTSQPLTYVMAWDRHGCVVDVTSRYASRWLHATQKLRSSSLWIQASLAPFQSTESRRQQVRLYEEAAMKKSAVGAGLPKHLSAYKQHPLYALESQLNKNQVLYPKG